MIQTQPDFQTALTLSWIYQMQWLMTSGGKRKLKELVLSSHLDDYDDDSFFYTEKYLHLCYFLAVKNNEDEDTNPSYMLNE